MRRSESGAASVSTEDLFRLHGRLVAGLCRGLLRDAHEAEDAAQQTFLLAHRAIARGDVPREPAAWLAAIARNECLGRIRERMRQPLALDGDALRGEADPVAEAARRADVAALWRALGALSQQQRDALLLREFGGLSYEEVAVALGVTVPAVESLIFRARTHLRGRLKAIAAVFNGVGELALRLLSGGGAAKVAATAVAASVVAGGAAVVGTHHMHTVDPGRALRSADPAAIASDLAPARPAVAARAVTPPAVKPPPRRPAAPTPVVFAAAAPPPPRPVLDTTQAPAVAPPTPDSTATGSVGGPAPTIALDSNPAPTPAGSDVAPSGSGASEDAAATAGDGSGDSPSTATTPDGGSSDAAGTDGPSDSADGTSG